jgi:hypothetical protein
MPVAAVADVVGTMAAVTTPARANTMAPELASVARILMRPPFLVVPE